MPMSVLARLRSQKESGGRRAGRALPAAVLFLVFCGVFSLLSYTSFLKPAARAEGAETEAETEAETDANPSEAAAEPPSEPVSEPADEHSSRHSMESFPYAGIFPNFQSFRNTLIWRNIPMLDDCAFVPRRHFRPDSAGCRFCSGGGEPLVGYSWGCEIPETDAVGPEYFADAAFIGNSLEEGFMLYGGLSTADFFAAKSITVKNIYTEKSVSVGGEFETIMEALKQGSYSKVYILLGLNEIGYDNEAFLNLYSKLIDSLRELQPGAEIYIQSITPVSKSKSESGSIFNNTAIRERNKALAGLAAQKKAHFVDIYAALADGDGNLPENASYDGIHPYKKYYSQWYEYLMKHTVHEVKD